MGVGLFEPDEVVLRHRDEVHYRVEVRHEQHHEVDRGLERLFPFDSKPHQIQVRGQMQGMVQWVAVYLLNGWRRAS